MTTGELLTRLVEIGLKNYDKARQPERQSETPPPAPAVGRVHIPASLQRAVWQRDGGSCTYVDPVTKVRCGGTHFVQCDHIVPVACGGKNELANLRLLCPAHNTHAAIETFGREKMERYLNREDGPRP